MDRTLTRPRPSLETVAYVLLALVLGAIMWRQVRQVDGFFLDEWFYVGGANYIWEHMPFGVLGEIPGWNRGPQRLYPLLLAPPFGLFSTSTAFTLAHLLNVVVLVSAIVPTALLARRLIDQPLLRVLATALAVAVPWLSISAHLLTENLAFPLYMWAVLAIVHAAERPSLRAQLVAIGAIVLLTLCRLNLAALFGVLVLAVLAAEVAHRRDHRDVPFAAWAKAALRRQAVVATATALGLVATLTIVVGGSAALGAYGGLDATVISDRLFGDVSLPTRKGMVTYLRGLVTGSFVLPLVLGLGVALAGLFGALGRRFFVPSVVALGGLVMVIVVVAVYTWQGALEERYVFPVYAPLAILAVAGVGSLARIRGFVAAGGAIAVWAMYAGEVRFAGDGGHFFAAPGGAFWSRVMEARIKLVERELFGWALFPDTGWILISVGIGVLLLLPRLLRRRPQLVTAVLVAGLALCGAAQTAALDYDLRQELHGTVDVPGGLVRNPGREDDRDDFADRALPEGARAVLVPAVSSPSSPFGYADHVEFWNRDVDTVAQLVYNQAPAPAEPGLGTVNVLRTPGELLAQFSAPPHPYVVMQPNDPRVQFATTGGELGRSRTLPFSVLPIDPVRRARWTSTVEADGAVLQGKPATLALDGTFDPPKTVILQLYGPGIAEQPTPWKVTHAGEIVASGTIARGESLEVRLEVPPCPADGSDCVHQWTLVGSGTPTQISFPFYGAPPPTRPVHLYLDGVKFE